MMLEFAPLAGRIGFLDPSQATGPEAQVTDLIQQVRDDVVSKILTLLEGSADN